MNKERRRRIKQVVESLTPLLAEVESIKDDEEFAFDSMPEGLQNSMRGEDSQEAIEYLDDATEKIEKAIECLEDAIDSLTSIS